MDIRFAAFALIARDADLRALLVNHADRIEHGPAVGDACSLALEWSGPDPLQAPAATQVLTARAHLPSRRAAERAVLDTVLARVRIALGAGTGVITIRYLGTSPPYRDGDLGALVRSSTFAVAARASEARHPARGAPLRRRQPRALPRSDLPRGRSARKPTGVTPPPGHGMLRDHRAR